MDVTQNFFAKNPALLGFSDERALFQTVKELVDNAIDATMLNVNMHSAIRCSVNLLPFKIWPSDKGSVTPHSSLLSHIMSIDDPHEYLSEISRAYHAQGQMTLGDVVPVEIVVEDTGVGFSNLSTLATSLFQSTKASDSGTIGQFGIGLKAILLHASTSNTNLPPILQISTRTRSTTPTSPSTVHTTIQRDDDLPYQHLTMSMKNGSIISSSSSLLKRLQCTQPHRNCAFSTIVTLQFYVPIESIRFCRLHIDRFSQCIRLINLPITTSLYMMLNHSLIDRAVSLPGPSNQSQPPLSSLSDFQKVIAPIRSDLYAYLRCKHPISSTISQPTLSFDDVTVVESVYPSRDFYHSNFSSLTHALHLDATLFTHGIETFYLQLKPRASHSTPHQPQSNDDNLEGSFNTAITRYNPEIPPLMTLATNTQHTSTEAQPNQLITTQNDCNLSPSSIIAHIQSNISSLPTNQHSQLLNRTPDDILSSSSVPMPWVIRLTEGLISSIHQPSFSSPTFPGMTTHVIVGDMFLNDSQLKPTVYPNPKRKRLTSERDEVSTSADAPTQYSSQLSAIMPKVIEGGKVEHISSHAPPSAPTLDTACVIPPLSTSSLQCFMAVQTTTSSDTLSNLVPFRVACMLNSTHVLSINPESDPLPSILKSQSLSHLGLSISHEFTGISLSSSSPTTSFSSIDGTPWLQAWLQRTIQINEMDDYDNRENPDQDVDNHLGGIRDSISGHASQELTMPPQAVDNPTIQVEHVVGVYLMINISIQTPSSLFTSLDKSSLALPPAVRNAILHCFHILTRDLSERYAIFATSNESDRHEILTMVAPTIGSTLASIVHSGSQQLRDKVAGLHLPQSQDRLASELTHLVQTLLAITGEQKPKHVPCSKCNETTTFQANHRMWANKSMKCDCNMTLVGRRGRMTPITLHSGCICVCHHPHVVALLYRRLLVKLCTYYPNLIHCFFTTRSEDDEPTRGVDEALPPSHHVDSSYDCTYTSPVSTHHVDDCENIDPNASAVSRHMSFLSDDCMLASSHTTIPPQENAFYHNSISPESNINLSEYLAPAPSHPCIPASESPSLSSLPSTTPTRISGTAAGRLARIQQHTSQILQNSVRLAFSVDDIIEKPHHSQ